MRHVESVKNSVGYLIRFQLHFMKGESFRVSITIISGKKENQALCMSLPISSFFHLPLFQSSPHPSHVPSIITDCWCSSDFCYTEINIKPIKSRSIPHWCQKFLCRVIRHAGILFWVPQWCHICGVNHRDWLCFCWNPFGCFSDFDCLGFDSHSHAQIL